MKKWYYLIWYINYYAILFGVLPTGLDIFVCIKGAARTLQTKHLKGSNYYNSKFFWYFEYNFFDVKFLILENFILHMSLSMIYQTRLSLFWSTKYTQQKTKIPFRDLCCSEPGYLTSNRDDSCVRYLVWFA